MGSGADYNPSSEKRWETTSYVDRYKVLKEKKDSRANNLPTYSNTSDVYFKRDDRGNVTQMRVYGEYNSRGVREPLMDIDLGYTRGHKQSKKKWLEDGVLHIHDYQKMGEGEFKRSKKARPPTLAEMGRYFWLWKRANPNVKVKLKF